MTLRWDIKELIHSFIHPHLSIEHTIPKLVLSRCSVSWLPPFLICEGFLPFTSLTSVALHSCYLPRNVEARTTWFPSNPYNLILVLEVLGTSQQLNSGWICKMDLWSSGHSDLESICTHTGISYVKWRRILGRLKSRKHQESPTERTASVAESVWCNYFGIREFMKALQLPGMDGKL